MKHTLHQLTGVFITWHQLIYMEPKYKIANVQGVELKAFTRVFTEFTVFTESCFEFS